MSGISLVLEFPHPTMFSQILSWAPSSPRKGVPWAPTLLLLPPSPHFFSETMGRPPGDVLKFSVPVWLRFSQPFTSCGAWEGFSFFKRPYTSRGSFFTLLPIFFFSFLGVSFFLSSELPFGDPTVFSFLCFFFLCIGLFWLGYNFPW